MVDGNGNPKPVIANLGPPAGQAASHSGDTMFVVKNEFGVKTQHSCGGVHAYVSPQSHDLCPEESAYYPKGAHIIALKFNQNWIQIQGKEEVPADIKIRQAARFAHVIPYWQQYGQQLQLTRAADEAAQPRPQLAIQDGSPRSQTPVLADLPVSAPAEIRGPDGFAMQVVAASARSEPATTESYVIATPRASPQQPYTGRSMISLPWRSTSCSGRAPTKREGSCMSTPGATDVAASTAPLRRFTFGGLEPPPAPDLPPLPMDYVKGLVVDNQGIRTGTPRSDGTRFWMLETRA